jgi:hypothetical protein
MKHERLYGYGLSLLSKARAKQSHIDKHIFTLHYKYLLVSLAEISNIHTSSCSHESMALPEKEQFQIIKRVQNYSETSVIV